MRVKQVAELAKVNLIYANPQMIENKRNKEAKKGTASKMPAYMSLVWQTLLMLAIFLLVFGFMFSNIDLVQYPGMFTTFTVMFLVMGLLQGFYMIYNLFYESKDLVHYLPLPFKESEVFTAKLSVLVFMMLPYMLPIWILFIFLGISAGNPVFLMLPGSLLLFVLVTGVVFSFSLILVHFITKLSLFRKHKQAVTTVLYALSSFGMVAVFFFLSSMEPEPGMMGQALPDVSVVPFFEPFHTIFVNPADVQTWLGILGWVLVLAGLTAVVLKWVIPNFYQEDTQIQKPEKEEEKTRKPSVAGEPTVREPASVNKTLLKYNFGLIQDGTLIMQFLSSKVLLPVVVIGPALFEGMDLGNLPLAYWPAAFFGGFIATFLTLNAISIVGVIISLDRENFLYMKSLPFSLSNYMKQKFLFAFGIEFAIPAILVLVFIAAANVPLLLGGLFLAGLGLGTLVLSHFYFVRDYRLLHLEWQNLTELFNRGGGTWIQFLMIFGSVFFGTLAVILVAVGLTLLPPVWRTVLMAAVVLLPLVLSLGLLYKYTKTFWPQFED